MNCYADTSFLLKLVSPEIDSERAVAEFRSLGFPPLFYTPLHGLEVTNAIRQRAFHLRRNLPAKERVAIPRERDAALARVSHWLKRGWLMEVSVDLEEAFSHSQAVSEKHTERLGCRAFDLIHVALALQLHAKVFLTADIVQEGLARTQGFQVHVPN
jgi:predicted nucleic acid-binding protein